MQRAAAAAAVALLALSALPADGQQQFGQCGDITLIFMNPDLRIREDGFVHVSGTFFIQFQAIGAQASQVSAISFGYGKPIPEPAVQCDVGGEPFTGAEIKHYRTDRDGSDGFFVPINTTLVPDGEYSASITAYDASGAYLARFFTRAVVENSPTCWPSRQACDDRVIPWPMILPGDGVQTNAGGGITIEFAEFVQDVFVRINGEQVIAQPWTPPSRDDDATPDNDAQECGTPDALRVIPVPCRRVVWGSGFRIDRDAADGDVIEVKAIDRAGNEAVKVVTVGGSTQGGAIELSTPELQMSGDSLEQQVQPGETVEYRVKLVNVGQGNAEARMTVAAPDGVVTEWDTPTVTVASGGEQFVTLKATPGQDVKPGGYTLVTRAIYKSGTDDVSKQLSLTLRVDEFRPVAESPLRQARVNRTDAEPTDAPARATPGLEPALAFAGFAVVALSMRRRAR